MSKIESRLIIVLKYALDVRSSPENILLRMAVTDIKRFTLSLQVADRNVEFELQPVNIREKQLYQVYTVYNGNQIRFHLQIQNAEQFIITDKNSCPKEYHSLESEFSAAILGS